MILLQVSVERIKNLIPILEKEMEKNPSGYIDIRIISNEDPLPVPSWSEDIHC
ncbi:MAG: hypothetical protein ACFFDN_04885 [Candidatus Hodarchaeota archaeon]